MYSDVVSLIVELGANEFEGEALPWSSCGGQLLACYDRYELRRLQFCQVQRQACMPVHVREAQRENRTRLKRQIIAHRISCLAPADGFEVKALLLHARLAAHQEAAQGRCEDGLEAVVRFGTGVPEAPSAHTRRGTCLLEARGWVKDAPGIRLIPAATITLIALKCRCDLLAQAGFTAVHAVPEATLLRADSCGRREAAAVGGMTLSFLH